MCLLASGRRCLSLGVACPGALPSEYLVVGIPPTPGFASSGIFRVNYLAIEPCKAVK